MIDIAVCDDDVVALDMISSELKHQFERLGQNTNITCFHLGRELRKSFYSGMYFDVFFLDIDMCDIDGIELAKQLREHSRDSLIIFISNHDEYVFKSFIVSPFRFIRKSMFKTESAQLAEDIIKGSERETKNSIVINARGMSVKLSPNEIIYIECNDKILHIVTEFKSLNLEFTLSEIEKLLENYGFIKTHKSYLVNYRYIFSIEKADVVLDTGDRIPVSKHRLAEVKKEFRSLTI